MPTSVKRVLLFIARFITEHGQASKNVTNGVACEPVAEAGGLKIEGEDGQVLWPHHDTLLIQFITSV